MIVNISNLTKQRRDRKDELCAKIGQKEVIKNWVCANLERLETLGGTISFLLLMLQNIGRASAICPPSKKSLQNQALTLYFPSLHEDVPHMKIANGLMYLPKCKCM